MELVSKVFLVFLLLIIIPSNVIAAADSKVKFNNQTYNLVNSDTKGDKYIYLLKNENIGNWGSQLYRESIKDKNNPTEAAAELAYKIQSENPKAVVLVYPEVATLSYLTFSDGKTYYEYNAIVFKNTKSGIEKFGFAKRFYASQNGGSDGARLAAVLFAEKNNKKYMEMVNKQFK